MNNVKRFSTGAVLAVFAMVGVGCGQGGEILDDIADSASGKMSELEYYNLVIENANEISENIEDHSESLDRYDNFATTRDEGTCDYTAPVQYGGQDQPNDARTALLDGAVTMENEENQAAVEELLRPYFDAHQVLLDSATAFQDYCEREQYKDDDGGQIEALYTAIDANITETTDKQAEVFALVKEYQQGVDLGIDENTSAPNEMVILIQNELTAEVEDTYKTAFTPYAEAVLAGEESDFAPVQTAYDELVADIATQTEKGNSVSLSDDQILGTAYDLYMQHVTDYSIELEKLARDHGNGEVTAENILDYDEGLINAYDQVISSHNTIVDALENYVQL